MSDIVSRTSAPTRHPPSRSVRLKLEDAGLSLTGMDHLPVALLLFRLVLERYGGADPDAAQAIAAFDRLQARLAANPGASALDRAAITALFTAVNKVRTLVQ